MFAVVRVAGPVLAALLLIGVCKFLHFDPLPLRALVCVRDYQAKCHSVLLGETLTVLLPQYLSIFADGR